MNSCSMSHLEPQLSSLESQSSHSTTFVRGNTLFQSSCIRSFLPPEIWSVRAFAELARTIPTVAVTVRAFWYSASVCFTAAMYSCSV